MIKSFIFSTTAALLACAAPAAAETSFEPVSGVVAVHGLDMTQPSDVTRFERRVRQQARSLCSLGGRVDLATRRDEATCLSTVMASAQAELPKLVGLAEARSAKRRG